MPATLSYTRKLVSVIKSKLPWLDMSVCKLDCNENIFVTLCSNIMNICVYYTLFSTTPVAPLREFLKYMRCSIILEGCNETLHNAMLLNSTMGAPLHCWGSMIVSAI